ncbi:MAG: extracellular solute-binding protein [Acidobacteriota bacterium]
MVRRSKEIWVSLIWVFISSILLAEPSPDYRVLLVTMPHAPPLDHRPSEVEIARFVSRWRESLSSATQQDLRKDPALARQLLGEKEIFTEALQFQLRSKIAVQLRFVDWTDAFRYFSDYVSDPHNPPLVAQLGDTWAAYFASLGVLDYQQRYTCGVRVLWYWKDLVDAGEIVDGDGFVAVCRKLHTAPRPELRAPFAIDTGPGWDLLHNLAIWLYNAGLPSLVSTQKKFGLIPWEEAVFASPEGERVGRFLIHLAERGYVALPDEAGSDLAEDFLARKYAMAILGTWVARRAETRLGPDWSSRIGITLPPRIGARVATTMKGGSVLVVLDPSRGGDSAGVARGRLLVDFLVSAESQRRNSKALGDLPANPTVLAETPFFTPFLRALEGGTAYPEIPQWAPVVENLMTRDNLYAFWKRLAALANTRSSPSKAEQLAREKLILAALNSAESDINRELSPGKLSLLRPWIVGLLALLFPISCAAAWRRHVERDRTRQRLRASEERYRDLYDNAPDMFCSVDAANGKIIECNRMLAEKTGFAKEEIIGRHILEVYYPDCREEVRKAVLALRETGEARDVELQLRRKNGGQVEVSVNVSSDLDQEGRIKRIRSVWRDITERKRVEKESLQLRQELAHVARVAMMGELAASLAHELNQPLTAIVSNAQVGVRMLSAGGRVDLDEVREMLSDIIWDGKRGGEVIERMRTLLKKGKIERTPVEINRVIQEVLALLRGQEVMANTRIRLHLATGLPAVLSDRIQLQQVVLNLILNGVEAMESSEIRELAVTTSLHQADTIEVAVRDSGAGLEATDPAHIFDAFFTTKAGGLGMGLSVSRTIIEAHGGRLWASPNSSGGGCTFHFTLPVLAPNEASGPASTN